MSSTPTETAPTPNVTATPQAPAAPAQEQTDWKAEARKWEDRAKENKTAAEKLAALEEASKTEEQKRADELAALQAKVAEYEKREQVATWKAEVAAASGVPVNVLAGSTREEIEAHAETLKPLLAQSQTPPRPQPLIVPAEGKTPPALNSDSLEESLRRKLGIN